MTPFTATQRKEIKARAKQSVTENFGKVIGVNTLAALPMVLIVIIFYAVLLIPMIAQGNVTALAELPATLPLLSTLFFLVAVFFIAGPLQYGLEKFHRDLWRTGEGHVSTLFQPFTSKTSYWAGVRVNAALALRSLIWEFGLLLLWYISFIIFGIRIVSESAIIGSTIFFLVFTLLLIAGLFLISVKLMTYGGVYYMLAESEARSAWALTRESASAFRHRYGNALVFVLSFFGWGLLYAALLFVCMIPIQMSTSIPVVVLASVAYICIALSLGSFIGAYQRTAFYGFFEAVRPRNPYGTSYAPQQQNGMYQQPYGTQPPQQPYGTQPPQQPYGSQQQPYGTQPPYTPAPQQPQADPAQPAEPTADNTDTQQPEE